MNMGLRIYGRHFMYSTVKEILIAKSVKLSSTALYERSSLAQLVEHAAVNRSAVGSSPTGGANKLSVQQPRSVVYDIGRGTEKANSLFAIANAQQFEKSSTNYEIGTLMNAMYLFFYDLLLEFFLNILYNISVVRRSS